MKKVSFFLLAVFFVFAAVSTFAQGGGKAEPNEIKFAKGRSSKVLTGTLGGDEEMEYSFGAKKGQKVTIANTKSNLFSFRIFNEDAGYNSEDISEKTFMFEIPESGEYMFFIKRTGASARNAAFALTITIK